MSARRACSFTLPQCSLLLLFLLTIESESLQPNPVSPAKRPGSSIPTGSKNNPSSSSNKSNNLNFEDWISDNISEVKEWQDVTTSVVGRVPSFLRGGTLVRNGPGLWTGPNGKEQYSHLFDGIAKWSAYRFISDSDDSMDAPTKSDDENDNIKVQYKSQFVRSQFYQEIQKQGRLVPTIGVGPILSTATDQVAESSSPPSNSISLWRMIQAVVNSVRIFDNAPVNIWDYNPNNVNVNKGDNNNTMKTLTGLTDAPARSILSFDNLETLQTFVRSPIPIEGLPLGYFEFLSTAHPAFSLTTDETYNIVLFLTLLDGPVIGLIKESNAGTRRCLVAKAPIASPGSSGGLPYTHSFGISTHYAIIVLQPLRVDITDIQKSLQVGFLRGMKPVDETIVLVFDLKTGQCLLNQAISEKIFFYHTASTAEYKDDRTGDQQVSIRLCAYKTPDIITGEDQFMRLERCRSSSSPGSSSSGKEARNRLSKGGTFCDVICNIKKQTVAVDWKPMPGNQGFEFPMTRYSRAHGPPSHAGREKSSTSTAALNSNRNKAPPTNKHPRFVYGIGHYAFGSDEYDSAALFKFEPETGQIAASYNSDSMYLSEPIVVANPKAAASASRGDDGSKEKEEDDDCVVLSQVFDGIRRETGLLVLDAKTMQPLAEVWTGRRSPMDFHGVWVPSSA